MPTDPTYLGLTVTNWILVGATILGPIVAVVITIVTERLRNTRNTRLNILQTILNTRQRPHDAAYQMAIMAVAIEFRKDREVMAAHLDLMRHVNLPAVPGGEQAQHQLMNQKLVSLMKLLFNRTGSKISEADIESLTYVTIGFANREKLLEDALHGIVRVADTLEKQTV